MPAGPVRRNGRGEWKGLSPRRLGLGGFAGTDAMSYTRSHTCRVFHAFDHWFTFALPASLYGVRLWLAVCLALFVAFWLQLENPSWAGTSAEIVCQPVL